MEGFIHAKLYQKLKIGNDEWNFFVPFRLYMHTKMPLSVYNWEQLKSNVLFLYLLMIFVAGNEYLKWCNCVRCNQTLYNS